MFDELLPANHELARLGGEFRDVDHIYHFIVVGHLILLLSCESSNHTDRDAVSEEC